MPKRTCFMALGIMSPVIGREQAWIVLGQAVSKLVARQLVNPPDSGKQPALLAPEHVALARPGAGEWRGPRAQIFAWQRTNG